MLFPCKKVKEIVQKGNQSVQLCTHRHKQNTLIANPSISHQHILPRSSVPPRYQSVNNHFPLPQPPYPTPRIEPPNPLPPNQKRHQSKIVHHQHRRKDPRHNNRIPTNLYPLQQIKPKSETNPALPQTLRDDQLGRISGVTVNRVRQGEGEVEVAGPVDHRDARKVADPVQVELGGEAVED
jgi:hypothetical protein